MSYLVLARKYRPETFSDVVGQESVSKTVQNSIRHGRIAHAFLFSGPRGVGKTSMARILSKAFNCEKGPTPEPCLECSKCREITAGSSMDVHEIDAASNRGIDNIRELRQNVGYAPASSRFKIYIIDEVHMLTGESFNALLKTLEEPPEHVKFIFATTEQQKLPETVRSRCQCFEFRRISTEDIVARLETIVKREGVEYEPGVLHRVASYARGGMRDAQSLLDQMIAFGGNRATFEGISELTGSLAPEAVAELVDAILDEEVVTVLDLTARFFSAGTRAEDLYRELIGHFRLLMLLLAGADSSSLGSTGADEARLKEQAARTDLDRILIILQIAMTSLRQSRFYNDDRILAEVSLVKMARVSSSIGLSEAVNLVRGGAGLPASPDAAPARRAAARPPAKQSSVPPRAASPRTGSAHTGSGRTGSGRTGSGRTASEGAGPPGNRPLPTGAEAPSAGTDEPPALLPGLPPDIGPECGGDLERLFSAILGELEKKSKTKAMSLRGFKPVALEKDRLILSDPGGGRGSLFSPDNADVAVLLRDASRRVAGRVLGFRVEKGAPGKTGGEVPPIVRKTKELFDGEIV